MEAASAAPTAPLPRHCSRGRTREHGCVARRHLDVPHGRRRPADRRARLGVEAERRHAFWQVVTSPQALAALKLRLGAAVLVVLLNAVLGTVTAGCRAGRLPRQVLVNAVIDLPFALPTIVAGLTLLTLYGPRSPARDRRRLHADGDRPRAPLRDAPVRHPDGAAGAAGLDVEMEEAARSLGAGPLTVFRRIVLPNILPGILSGVVLALARALGEIGAVVLISGNLPYHTEVASVFVLSHIESGDSAGAAAVAVVLLGASFVLLLAIGALRFFVTRHERA